MGSGCVGLGVHGRWRLCVCVSVCSHSAKVFVSSSNFYPNPFISPPCPKPGPCLWCTQAP